MARYHASDKDGIRVILNQRPADQNVPKLDAIVIAGGDGLHGIVDTAAVLNVLRKAGYTITPPWSPESDEPNVEQPAAEPQRKKQGETMTDTNDKLKMPPGFRWHHVSRTLQHGSRFVVYCRTVDDALALAHDLVRPAVEAATAELRAELERCKSERDKAEANYAFMVAFMVKRAADTHLDGHRELGARAAKAENESDALRARAGKAEAQRDAMITEVRAIPSDHTGVRVVVTRHDYNPSAWILRCAEQYTDLHELEAYDVQDAKAEAALAELRTKVGEALALTADRERFVMMGPLAYAQVEKMLREALAAASRGEGE